MSPGPIAYRSLTSTQLGQFRGQWRTLLANSDADRLFLDWAWQHLWWQKYSPDLRRPQLHCLIAEDAADRIIAIVNAYTHQARRLPLLSLRSLQLVGAAWRTSHAMLSEYLEPIVQQRDRGSILYQLLEQISNLGWDECVFELTPSDGHFATTARDWCLRHRWYLRELDSATSYQADLSAGFSTYIACLSANTRRRVLNNRKKLLTHGRTTVLIHQGEQADAALTILNSLHQRRWGQPAYDQQRLAFLREFHATLPPQVSPLVSVIEVDGTPISALYDIRFPDRQYNLQMGFDPGFDSTLSLGLLHLGYAMEDASANRVLTYDFLGGGGKRTNYKEHISTGKRQLVTLQIIRHPLTRWIYRLSDLARGRYAAHT